MTSHGIIDEKHVQQVMDKAILAQRFHVDSTGDVCCLLEKTGILLHQDASIDECGQSLCGKD